MESFLTIGLFTKNNYIMCITYTPTKIGLAAADVTTGDFYTTEVEDARRLMDELMKYTDLVMLDIKHIDSTQHHKLTGQTNIHVLEFAKYLSEKNIPTWIRHVVVPEITYNEEYLTKLGEFLAELKNIKALDVLPYHDMARGKYKELGLKYPLENIQPLTKEEAINARNIIIQAMKNKRNFLTSRSNNIF